LSVTKHLPSALNSYRPIRPEFLLSTPASVDRWSGIRTLFGFGFHVL
jgi:hypothetical protein